MIPDLKPYPAMKEDLELGQPPHCCPAWMEISARDYTRKNGKALVA